MAQQSTGTHCGWLKKLGADKLAKRRSSLSAEGGLKDRWFEVHPAHAGEDGAAATAQLRYFGPAGIVKKSCHVATLEPYTLLTEKPKGVIDLVRGALRVVEGDEPASTRVWPESGSVFRLVGVGPESKARTWVLCAPSEEARCEWIAALALHLDCGEEAAPAAAASARCASVAPVKSGSLEQMASAAASAQATDERDGLDHLVWFEAGELAAANVQIETSLDGTSVQIKADQTPRYDDAKWDGARGLRKDDVVVAVNGEPMHGLSFAQVAKALKALKASSERGSITVRRPKHVFPAAHADSLERRASASRSSAGAGVPPIVVPSTMTQPTTTQPTAVGNPMAQSDSGSLANLYEVEEEPPCCAYCFVGKHGGSGMGVSLQVPLLGADGGARGNSVPSESALAALHKPAELGDNRNRGISQIDIADL